VERTPGSDGPNQERAGGYAATGRKYTIMEYTPEGDRKQM